MLVRYNLGDAWGRAMSYGFACLGAFAYSLSVSADVPGGKKIEILRDVAAADVRDGIRFPRVDDRRRTRSACRSLCSAAPRPPTCREPSFGNCSPAIFGEPDADRAFDGIAHFNRIQFLNLLRLLRKHDGALVRVLEEAAIDQLETLSNCIGCASVVRFA